MKYAVYRFKNHEDVLLYVGYSATLAQRIAAHSNDKNWFEEVEHIKVDWFDTWEDASEFEELCIASLDPLYNVAGSTRPYVKPNVNRRPSQSAENKRRAAAVEATMAYLTDAERAELRDQLLSFYDWSVVEEDVSIPMQRRLAIILNKRAFSSWYRVAHARQTTATRVPHRIEEASESDWSGAITEDDLVERRSAGQDGAPGKTRN